jgi:hypothetical protein
MNRYLMLAVPFALVATTAVHAAMSPRDYVTTAGASDLFERQSSQLIADTTRNPKLRAFARQMIADHTKSTTMVKAAATRAHMRLTPPMLTTDQRDMMAKLRAAHAVDVAGRRNRSVPSALRASVVGDRDVAPRLAGSRQPPSAGAPVEAMFDSGDRGDARPTGGRRPAPDATAPTASSDRHQCVARIDF